MAHLNEANRADGWLLTQRTFRQVPRRKSLLQVAPTTTAWSSFNRFGLAESTLAAIAVNFWCSGIIAFPPQNSGGVSPQKPSPLRRRRYRLQSSCTPVLGSTQIEVAPNASSSQGYGILPRSHFLIEIIRSPQSILTLQSHPSFETSQNCNINININKRNQNISYGEISYFRSGKSKHQAHPFTSASASTWGRVDYHHKEEPSTVHFTVHAFQRRYRAGYFLPRWR